MDGKDTVEKTLAFVKDSLAGAEGGHDFQHACRVWRLSRRIAETEDVDLLVVELGAILHDIADSKFHDGDEEIGPRRAREFLDSIGVDRSVSDCVVAIVANISFKGEGHVRTFRSPELDVVQDADRLDAMGAIGIARTFNYGGFRNRALYDPDIPPNPDMTAEEYRRSDAPTINHFYEKLLLLRDRMNTDTGRKMAEVRHAFMERFLEEFYAEWEGRS